MTDADELALIERDIEETRKRIALDRRMLDEQLGPYGASPDLVDELLTLVDELGAGPVRDRLAAQPDALALAALPPGNIAVVGQLLDQLFDASADFDRLVAARENILVQADPARERVYPWFGREFQIAADRRTLRFADAPQLPEPMTLEAVPNRAAPRHSPDAAPPPQRRRRRDRDR